MKACIFSLLWLAFASTFASTFASESVILDQTTRDWKQVATLAERQQLPVLIIVSGEHCGYCQRLKNEIVKPMQHKDQWRDTALVREIDLDTGGKITDFDGEKVRARIFLSRYKVFATPTVLFLDAHGERLHEPLVGFNGVDKYQPLLRQALRKSLLALQQRHGGAQVNIAGAL